MLTAIKLKLKTKLFTKSLCIRFDLEKLKDQKIAEVLRAKVGGKFASLCVLDSDVVLADLAKRSKRSATLNNRKGPWEKKGEDSTYDHKRGSGSVRPETAAETIEVHKH